MVLIVATDAQPITALRRLFSRIGFVLLPASVLLIYYYPDLGQEYGFNNGVTTNKNILGDLVYLVMLASLWQVLSLIRDRNESNRARRLVAQCTLLAFGIWLLFLADCATAVACVILGALLMLATSLPLIGRRAAAVHCAWFSGSYWLVVSLQARRGHRCDHGGTGKSSRISRDVTESGMP